MLLTQMLCLWECLVETSTIIPYFLQRKTRFIVHAAVLLLHKTGITNPSLTYNEKQMESALRLHCYTLPRTPLPLRIPSSYHAANLQFSFRRSPFSPGKGFRSYPARQILGPITCAAGGFRTPSRRNKANDHNMAKRVGRASFTLACVIGIIGCSFWVKQEVMAARQVGKVSYQMRSAAREGVSMRPDSATKVLFFTWSNFLPKMHMKTYFLCNFFLSSNSNNYRK